MIGFLLGLVAVGTAALTYRAGSQGLSGAVAILLGDQVLIAPGDLLAPVAGLDPSLEFVVLTVASTNASAGTVTGYLVGSSSSSSLSSARAFVPPLGPTSAQRSAIRAILRGGQVIWTRSEG